MKPSANWTTFDVEFHVINDFKPKFLLGRDVITDYNMDLFLTEDTGTINVGEQPFEFALEEPYQAYKSVLVRARERTKIPGRSWQAISVRSFMAPNRDYSFVPFVYVKEGEVPSPQLPSGIVDSNLKSMVFMNASENPIILERGQILGRATVIKGMIQGTGMELDFADMQKPTNALSAGNDMVAPDALDIATLYAEADFSSTAFTYAMAAHRTPRSIPEDMLRELIKKSTPWSKNDAFPNEDDPETLKIPELPPIPMDHAEARMERKDFNVNPALAEPLREALLDMLESLTDTALEEPTHKAQQ